MIRLTPSWAHELGRQASRHKEGDPAGREVQMERRGNGGGISFRDGRGLPGRRLCILRLGCRRASIRFRDAAVFSPLQVFEKKSGEDHAHHEDGQDEENAEKPDEKGSQGIPPEGVPGTADKGYPAVRSTVRIPGVAVPDLYHQLLNPFRMGDIFGLGIGPGDRKMRVEHIEGRGPGEKNSK